MSETYTAVKVEMVDQQQPPTQQGKRKFRSSSCRMSSAITGRATRRCTCSTASSSRSGAGSRWRSWPHQAPASRRCCTSPACSSIPIMATSMSTAARLRSWPIIERTRIRRNEIGFVYQSHHLLPEFSALENVLLPQMIRGLTRTEAKTRAVELLTYLGLGRPSQSSAVGTVRRRAAAGRHCARSRQMPRAFSWPTSRPGTSTCTPPSTCFARWRSS